MLASILAFAPTEPGAGPSAEPGALLGILITVGVVFLIIALVAVILDILAHFKAAGIFDSKWFKLGGWFRIGAIIAIVIAIPLTIVSALSMGLQGILGQMAPGAFPFGLLFSILWPLIIVFVVSLLATIFSIIAFFTIPEEAPQPESLGLAA